jgi:two-component system phosphate regulon sensor histidine kinase PhoR
MGWALFALSLVTMAALAVLWLVDVARLGEALRHADRATGGGNGQPPAAPRLLPMAGIARGIERLARDQAARMVQARRRQEADAAIIEKLPDPLIVLGATRSVDRANEAARAAFGADLPAVLRHPTLRGAIDRATAQNLMQTADLSLPVPVAREVQATVIRLADGGLTVLVLSDRTRERAVERMREDFVANASHELRTPLASLVGFIETLRGPAADDPPAQQRFLGIMAEQATRMNRLIDDLLSLSRIELTEHQAPIGRFDAESVIRSIAAGFEPRLAERRMTLTLAVETDLPEVPGDVDQIEQVLQNLLDNAVKYGREGGVVQVRAARAASQARWPSRAGLMISVIDDGQGIARVHLSRLTERFYRVDKGRSRAAGGTGLGLAIVKHIVNRHRGQLVVESEEGAGSTFSVWLPLA